jgi:dTDP-glucose pyrophosphorylase
MIEIEGRPILQHVIDFWRPFTDRFVFVVKHQKESLIRYVRSTGIPADFVEPESLRGIADGLRYARPYVDDRFIAVLGDCLCRGAFRFPADMRQGVGVWRTPRTEDIQRSYAVVLDPTAGLLRSVEEKPRNPPNDLCGMGFYFFDGRVFDAIGRTPPSALRGEVEITDVIGVMLGDGEPVHGVFFEGDYLNVTHPEDLERARRVLA